MEESRSVSQRLQIYRNRLNLEQRIQVLKEYAQNKGIGELAVTFQCGPTQIQNILRKRKKYLAMWSRKRSLSTNKGEAATGSPSSTVDAVGFVLREWIERARSYQINYTDEILISIAQQISDIINLKEFKPSKEWLITFKEKYKIAEIDMNIKREQFLMPQERKSLSINIIIDDLRRQYGQQAVPKRDYNDSFSDDEESFLESNHTNLSKFSTSDSNDSAVCIRDDKNPSAKPGNYDSKFAKEVESYKDALNLLGPLERFALFNEDVRAVGLINQLENLFREKMAKMENFF